MKKGTEARAVVIEGFDSQGRGIASFQGRELIAAGGCPGDVVDLRVEHISPHGPEVWCEIIAARSRGEFFSLPVCPHQWPVRGRCGGCPAMHIEPAALAEIKRSAVRDALVAAGIESRISWSPSPADLDYRNRGQFVAWRGRGNTVLGSYAPRSHRVVSMEGCPVLRSPIGEAARAVEASIDEVGAPIHPGDGGIRYVTVRGTGDGRALVDIVASAPEPPWLVALLESLMSKDVVAGVGFSTNSSAGNAIRVGPSVSVAGDAVCLERVGSLELELEAASFSQLNSPVSAAMYERAARMVPGPGVVWDLYCGVGGLGLTVASAHPGTRLFGADSVARSVELARRNGERAGVDGVFAEIDLSKAGPGGWPSPETVLVNPPRRGLDGVVLEIIEGCGATSLVYMSCNPASFAGDAAALVDGGWVLGEVHAHDMLPGTAHVEIMAAFSRTWSGDQKSPL